MRMIRCFFVVIFSIAFGVNAVIAENQASAFALTDSLNIANVELSISIDKHHKDEYIRLCSEACGDMTLDRRIDLLETIISKYPKRVGAYELMALSFANVGNYYNVVKYFGKAIKLAPDKDYLYNNRGLAYHYKSEINNTKGSLAYKKDIAKALKDYNKAIEINDNKAVTYYNRANVYFQMLQYKDALNDIDKAISLNPDKSSYYVLRANLYHKNEDYEHEIQDLTQSVRIDSLSDNIYYRRANAYAAIGDYEKAIADYGKAIEINPNKIEYYTHRSYAYLKNEDKEGMEKDARMVEKIQFENKIAWMFKYIKKCFNRGDYTNVVRACNEVIMLIPDSEEAYQYKANAYYSLGDYNRSLQSYNEIIRMHPDSARNYNARAVVYMNLGHLEFAMVDCNNAIRKDSTYPDSYYNRATIHYKNGDYDNAIKDVSTYLSLSPTADGYSNRGIYYYAKDDYENALIDFDKAVELKPNSQAYHRNRGMCYQELAYKYPDKKREYMKKSRQDMNFNPKSDNPNFYIPIIIPIFIF